MEMKNELPPSDLSPEVIAEMEKSRASEEKWLLEHGAKYKKFDGWDNEILVPAKWQKRDMVEDMKDDLGYKDTPTFLGVKAHYYRSDETGLTVQMADPGQLIFGSYTGIMYPCRGTYTYKIDSKTKKVDFCISLSNDKKYFIKDDYGITIASPNAREDVTSILEEDAKKRGGVFSEVTEAGFRQPLP